MEARFVMDKVKNYDMSFMRKTLILLFSKSLKKDSNWYQDDYNTICKAVNSKTRKELIETLERWNAVDSLKISEVNKHCQF